MANTPDQGIGTRTVRGMFWSYGSFVGVRLASLVTTAVLARLLDPKDFGLIALALTFMSFLDMLQGLGVADALVVAEDSQLGRRVRQRVRRLELGGACVVGHSRRHWAPSPPPCSTSRGWS